MEMVNIQTIFGIEFKEYTWSASSQFDQNLSGVITNLFAGVITKTEMGNVVVAVCELMGIDLRPPVGSHSFCYLMPIV